MQVMLYASETLMFSFSSAEMKVHVPASAKFFAVKHDGTLIPLFRLDVVNLHAHTNIHTKWFLKHGTFLRREYK